MGMFFSRGSVQTEHIRPEIEIDLQESVISEPNWETRSWLDYAFPRDVHSVPSSLANSWVNLDYSGNPHLLESTTPRGSVRQLGDSGEMTGSQLDISEINKEEGRESDENDRVESLITSTPKLESSTALTLSELAVCCQPGPDSGIEDPSTTRGISTHPRHFIDGLSSLQRTPTHTTSLHRFNTNRSWTFSGAGSDYPSPGASLFSGNSSVSIGRPNSPQCAGGSLTPSLISASMDREKGTFISGLLQTHFVALIDQITPQDVARHLYNLAILNTTDLKRASNVHIDESDRAQAIVLCLKKKLRYKPELFSDVCAALKKAGVEVIQKIKAEVRSRYPDDEDLTRSMSVLSRRDVHTPDSFNCGASFSVEDSEQDSSCGGSSQELSEHVDHLLTSLEQAFRDGDLAAAKNLIARETAKQNNMTLLHGACKLEVNVCVLSLLLTEITHSVSMKDQHNRTTLHMVCACLKQTPQTSSQQDMQAHHAHLKQQRMKVENLLKHGANRNEQDKDGNSPLHLATLRRDPETVELLLRRSATCVDLTNRLGNTALHIACREGYPEVVKVLCDYNANASLPNRTRKQRTPMLEACSNEHVGVAQTMMDYDRSSLDGTDSKKRTPLHVVTRRQNSTLTEALSDCPECEPYQLDQDNKTPLHYACYWGGLDLVIPLLARDSSKAFVNAQDRNGDTALHIASRRGHKRVIKLLLSKNASKGIKNQEGKTPVDLARQWEHKKAAKLLSKKSPWLKRRKRRSSESSLKRFGTQTSLTSEASIDAQNDMILSSAESDCDETIDY